LGNGEQPDKAQPQRLPAGILRLTVPVGLTTGANSQLAGNCPSGKFTNPQTELTMRDFIIVQYYTVTEDAVCE